MREHCNYELATHLCKNTFDSTDKKEDFGLFWQDWHIDFILRLIMALQLHPPISVDIIIIIMAAYMFILMLYMITLQRSSGRYHDRNSRHLSPVLYNDHLACYNTHDQGESHYLWWDYEPIARIHDGT